MTDRPAVTRILAEFAVTLRFDAIPGSAVEMAKMLTLNIVTAAMTGSTLPAAASVVGVHLRAGGTAESTVIGTRQRLPRAAAAAVNAHCAYCTMNDDSFMQGDMHPGHAAVAAALAVAESVGASGRDFVTAVIAGIEVGCRIGASLCQSQESHKARAGWHCNLGDAFVAAVAAGKLLGLTEDQFVAAIGIAATAASGLNEVMNPPPSYVWPWDGGRNTGQGVLAAELALAGMTAGETALEGHQGFIEMFTGGRPGANAFDTAIHGLGSEWTTGQLLIKTRSASVMTHSAIDAVQDIVLTHDLAAGEIRVIEVDTNKWTVEKLCHRDVSEFNVSVFSLPFAIALAVCTRDRLSLPAAHQAHLDDPDVRALMDRVVAYEDSEIDKVFGFSLPAHVTIRTFDGRTFEAREDIPYGQYPHKPLDPALFTRKLQLNAAAHLSVDRVDQLIAWVGEELTDATDLDALRPLLLPTPEL